jgi:hypothetical protein
MAFAIVTVAHQVFSLNSASQDDLTYLLAEYDLRRSFAPSIFLYISAFPSLSMTVVCHITTLLDKRAYPAEMKGI